VVAVVEAPAVEAPAVEGPVVEAPVGEGPVVEGPVVVAVVEAPVVVGFVEAPAVEGPVAGGEPGVGGAAFVEVTPPQTPAVGGPTTDQVVSDAVDADVARLGLVGGDPEESDPDPDPDAPPPDLAVVDDDTPAGQAGSVPDPPPADQLPVLASVPAGDATTAKAGSAALAPARRAATAAPADDDDPERRHSWRTVARAAAWTTAIFAVAVVLLVFVFPTRTYLSQRRQLTSAANQLQVLDQQNAQLTAQVARLQTDGEIERLAREQYHLVRPGERAFAILPAPSPPTPALPAPPRRTSSGGWVHRLTSWIP
jgi:cell division protein FtsB